MNRSLFAPGWMLTGQAPAAGIQRKGFRVKAKPQHTKMWVHSTHVGLSARIPVQKKGRTESGKNSARGVGADHNKVKCVL